MHDAKGVCADEIIRDFEGSGRAGLGVILEHLAPAGDARIG